MSLEQILKTAVSHLRSGRVRGEAQVKQSVILPVLRRLDWDDTDPEAFEPEYSAGRGSVDYALLDRGRPLVFIEAKRVGAMDAGGEEQLFGYASNRGVPLLVLTDGNRWDFYLSMAAGVPEERRFYRLDLQHERKIPEYVEFLEEYLWRDRVVSGQAKRSAEQRHARNQERERVRRAIPDAWRTLLREPDEMLRDLLAEQVEDECGTKPELHDVEEFLRDLPPPTLRPKPKSESSIPSSGPVSPPPGTPQPERSKTKRSGSKIVGFTLDGKRFDARSAIGTLVEIVKILDHRDPEFMERFAARTVSKGRSLVDRDRTKLYKKSPHLTESSKDLGNGWWLGSNLSTAGIEERIETACRTAGVRFGSELKLIKR